MADVLSVRMYRAGDDSALWAIADTALTTGELTGWTRHDLAGWRARLPLEDDGTLVALEDDEVAGFFTPIYPLLVVSAGHRRRGHGTRLVEAAIAAARRRGEGLVRLAPPRGSVVAATFAERLGFRYHSSLWQLRLPPQVPTPPVAFPPAVTVRNYLPEDLLAYVELINAAFADHPSPIGATEQVVRHVHGLPDFDPNDILVVENRDRPGELVAFCRTGIEREADSTTGEVTHIGVLPAWQGQGIGSALLAWGIDRLRAAGADEVTLIVEALNQRALRLYERMGFVRAQEWPRWTRSVDTARRER